MGKCKSIYSELDNNVTAQVWHTCHHISFEFSLKQQATPNVLDFAILKFLHQKKWDFLKKLVLEFQRKMVSWESISSRIGKKKNILTYF